MIGSRADPRGERGFTLIEALVALTIGGFVVATLATVTGQWLRSWSHGAAVLKQSEQLVAGLDRIAADLAAARFMPAGPTEPGLLFAGDASSVTLVRRTLPVQTPAGLELVRLGPMQGHTDVTLARSRAALPFGTSVAAPTDPDPVVLLRPPFALRFSYADADRAWRPVWQAPARLPRLVRMEVVDRRSGRPLLAPIVVAVQVEAPAACATVTSAALCDRAMGRIVEVAGPAATADADAASAPHGRP